MVEGKVKVSSGVNRFAELQAQLKDLAKQEILVGIPEEKSTRDGSGEINNAELLYIQTHGVRKKEMRDEMQPNLDGGMKYSAAHSLYVQEHGSPLWHVPPRPVLEPAIEKHKDEIAEGLKEISKASLDGDPVRARTEMHRTGLDAAGYVQDWFEDPENGWPENAESTKRAKGSDQPLVDTNEMRKSITYVVRDKT